MKMFLGYANIDVRSIRMIISDYEYLNFIKKVSINVETTNKCVLKCPGCERSDINTEKDKQLVKEKIKSGSDIPLSTVEKIFNFFNQINFCGQISDPIYHKNFLGLLELTNKFKGKMIIISTNGSHKPIEWFQKAFTTAPHVKWIFALDGLPDTSPIYRINQKSYEVWEAMKLGASILAREPWHDYSIVWKYIVFKYNEHQIDEARQLAGQHNIYLILAKSSRWYLKNIIHKYKPSDKWTSTSKSVTYVS